MSSLEVYSNDTSSPTGGLVGVTHHAGSSGVPLLGDTVGSS